MAINQSLNLTTSQNLVMTPAMQQAIKILEFNQLEMQEYIDQQLLENPLLQASQGDDDFVEGSPDQEGMIQGENNENHADTGGDGLDDGEIADVGDSLARQDFDESAAAVDSNFENDFDVGYGDRLINAAPDGAYDEDMTPWEERTANKESLQEVLQRQIAVTFPAQEDALVASHLCEYLDANGWMIGDLHSIAEELGSTREKVLAVLHQMQEFEPSGIFARDLAECLKIQLKMHNTFSPQIAVLLENLPLIAEGKFSKIMRLCKCSEDELRDMLALIRQQNPKPASDYDILIATTVVPDVFVRKNPDGTWGVELNEQNLPRLLVDRHYYAKAVAGSKKAIEKEYLSTHYQNAQWLKKAVHQRAITILSVSAAIVEHQHRFLEYGVSALEPLVLAEIAEKIDMHPSTVSRATSDKYISTPRGVFELKYLFQNGIESKNNPNVRFSAEAIRYRIKELIGEEKCDNPISDDALSQALDNEGIRLARRTIAKYREEMNIPSSSKRKRQNQSVF